MNANKIHAIARIKEDAIMRALESKKLVNAAPAYSIGSKEIIKNVNVPLKKNHANLQSIWSIHRISEENSRKTLDKNEMKENSGYCRQSSTITF